MGFRVTEVAPALELKALEETQAYLPDVAVAPGLVAVAGGGRR